MLDIASPGAAAGAAGAFAGAAACRPAFCPVAAVRRSVGGPPKRALGVAFTQPARGQVYSGAAIGSARTNVDCAGTTSCDKTDSGWKLFGGYQFNPNWAAEVTYFDFGKAKVTGIDETLGTITGEIENTGFGAGMALRQNLAADWNFVARFGLASIKTKVSGAVTGIGSGSDSDRNGQPYAGLGVGYKLSKSMSVDAARDFSKGKYNKNGVETKGNVSMNSIGVTAGF